MRIPILVGLVGKKSEFYMENILKADTVVGKKTSVVDPEPDPDPAGSGTF